MFAHDLFNMVFHVFTVGVCMIGWHSVPTGFVTWMTCPGGGACFQACLAYIRVPAVKILII